MFIYRMQNDPECVRKPTAMCPVVNCMPKGNRPYQDTQQDIQNVSGRNETSGGNDNYYML